MPYWLLKASPKCKKILSQIVLGDSQNVLDKIKEMYHLLYCAACYRFKKCNKAIEVAAKKSIKQIDGDELNRINTKSFELLEKFSNLEK
jgi:hypothetical protein